MTSQTPGAGGGGSALSTWATENSWRARPPGHILGSYLTRVLHTARISQVDVVLCGDAVWIHALVPFATSVINFSAQRQLCHLTFVGVRNLSNHTKASSRPLVANLKILDVFSIYSVEVSSSMYLYHNDVLPISFTQIFQTGNQIHQYSTRYSDFYRPHTCRKNIKKFRSCFEVLEYWIHYRTTSKTPRLLIYSSLWSNHF